MFTQRTASSALPNLDGGASSQAVTTSAPATQTQAAPQGDEISSLNDVRGSVTMGEGDTGAGVSQLQELIGVPQTGVFDQATGDKVAQLKEQFNLGGDPRLVGETTLRVFRQNLSDRISLGNGVSVNTNHPHLQTLSNNALHTGDDGTCVPTTLGNMDRLGVPSFSGGTLADPNNSRGAMSQMLQAGHWESLPLPGSQQRTINSNYGDVQANVLTGEQFAELARQGQIPEGSVVFQTEHGWDYSGGPYGNDMGIWRDGGVHNFRQMGPLVYGSATKEVVVLVPKGSVIRE